MAPSAARQRLRGQTWGPSGAAPEAKSGSERTTAHSPDSRAMHLRTKRSLEEVRRRGRGWRERGGAGVHPRSRISASVAGNLRTKCTARAGAQRSERLRGGAPGRRARARARARRVRAQGAAGSCAPQQRQLQALVRRQRRGSLRLPCGRGAALGALFDVPEGEGRGEGPVRERREVRVRMRRGRARKVRLKVEHELEPSRAKTSMKCSGAFHVHSSKNSNGPCRATVGDAGGATVGRGGALAAAQGKVVDAEKHSQRVCSGGGGARARVSAAGAAVSAAATGGGGGTKRPCRAASCSGFRMRPQPLEPFSHEAAAHAQIAPVASAPPRGSAPRRRGRARRAGRKVGRRGAGGGRGPCSGSREKMRRAISIAARLHPRLHPGVGGAQGRGGPGCQGFLCALCVLRLLWEGSVHAVSRIGGWARGQGPFSYVPCLTALNVESR